MTLASDWEFAGSPSLVELVLQGGDASAYKSPPPVGVSQNRTCFGPNPFMTASTAAAQSIGRVVTDAEMEMDPAICAGGAKIDLGRGIDCEYDDGTALSIG